MGVDEGAPGAPEPMLCPRLGAEEWGWGSTQTAALPHTATLSQKVMMLSHRNLEGTRESPSTATVRLEQALTCLSEFLSLKNDSCQRQHTCLLNLRPFVPDMYLYPPSPAWLAP